MAEFTREDTIRKIQKLFARAKDPTGVTQEEASSCLAQAQALCAKLNLDLAVIEDTYLATGGSMAIKEKREKTKVNRSAMYQWQRDFWKALAQMNFCFHWVTTVKEQVGFYHSDPKRSTLSYMAGEPKFSKVKRHVLLGKESNVIIVKLMGEYITDTFERILPWPNKERLSRAAISWRMGAAARILERLEEQHQQARKVEEGVDSPQNSTALALRSLDEREYEANYDSMYGEGAYLRGKAEQAAWAAERLEAQQQETARRAALTPEERAAEDSVTEAKLAKERKLQQRRWERDQARWNRESRREAEKIDLNAYHRGSKAADSISLVPQVKAGKTPEALRG